MGSSEGAVLRYIEDKSRMFLGIYFKNLNENNSGFKYLLNNVKYVTLFTF